MTNVADRSTLLLCFKRFMASYLSFEEIIAIIPVPWNVSFPVSVRMLWSISFATHWTRFVLWSSWVLFALTTNCLNSLTLYQKICLAVRQYQMQMVLVLSLIYPWGLRNAMSETVLLQLLRKTMSKKCLQALSYPFFHK